MGQDPTATDDPDRIRTVLHPPRLTDFSFGPRGKNDRQRPIRWMMILVPTAMAHARSGAANALSATARAAGDKVGGGSNE